LTLGKSLTTYVKSQPLDLKPDELDYRI